MQSYIAQRSQSKLFFYWPREEFVPYCYAYANVDFSRDETLFTYWWNPRAIFLDSDEREIMNAIDFVIKCLIVTIKINIWMYASWSLILNVI